MPDMITPYFSVRYRRKRYRIDITLGNGQRIRRSFDKKSDAEAVIFKYKHDDVSRRYGLPRATDQAFLSDLIEKRLTAYRGAEHTRASRVLRWLASLLPHGICVDEVSKAAIQKYVERRFNDGLKAQSIDRELNIIAAMFNSVDLYFPQLEQWRPPRMPRPKIIGGRRERIWSDHEIKVVLAELYADRREGEQRQSAAARHKVGRIVQFCLLNGVRTGEMAQIRKRDINWQTRKVRIEQGKTGKVKVIGPLAVRAMEILEECCNTSETEFVFFKGKNIPPKFYKTLARACERAGVAYGKNTPGGLVLYDSRHTATTHMLESGVSPATVKEWMGWADSSFVLYYSHATEQSREKAGRVMERKAGKKIA
jgi:integrase